MVKSAPAAAHDRAATAADKQARQFAVDAARFAANTRCHNVVLLDVRGLSPVTDYMILATGTSARQMKTVCDDLTDMARERGERPLAGSDTEGDSWILVDFVNVVVHLFSPEARLFYDLDSLWGDAKPIDWAAEAPPPPAPAG